MMKIHILKQPNDETCGPTSLHAVYNYYGEKIPLQQVISEISYLKDGGTLAVMLAIHALKKGYDAKIYTYNLKVFDPNWFTDKKINIKEKLKEQLQYKKGKKFIDATNSYIEYLDLGGVLLLEDLRPSLFRKYFNKNIPILTGLSVTYLYNCPREHFKNGISIYDDVKGYASGHFVILAGYDKEKKHVLIADPYKDNPLADNQYYSVSITRLINSIMLGIVTYDANLLIIEPKDRK